MRDTEKITLKKMRFAASVGVAEWEREARTAIEVDVELWADLHEACKTDDVNDTIDYAETYDLVNRVVMARHYNLLESLAEAIAASLKSRASRECGKIVIRVRKPRPPVGGMCDYAEVEIVR